MALVMVGGVDTLSFSRPSFASHLFLLLSSFSPAPSPKPIPHNNVNLVKRLVAILPVATCG